MIPAGLSRGARRVFVSARSATAATIAITSVAATIFVGAGTPAHAEPAAGDTTPAPPLDPYPKLQYFTKIDAAPYILPGQGVWFTTPLGLNCGIWWRGSFGCNGHIPGAPDGVTHIGWYTGDARVHYDWTMAARWPPSQGVLSMPPLTYIESEDTTAATTLDGSTYFERGPWRLLITPTHTWLNGVIYK
jgi:hypothetical protein